MGQTVLDSTNIVEYLNTGKAATPESLKSPETKAESAPEPKADEPKAEAPPEPKAAPDGSGAPEDDEGVTADEKAELTEAIKRKIGKKHRQMREAEEFAEENYRQRRMAEAEADRLRRELERAKTQQAPPAEPEAKKPARGDFETEEQYQDALVDYRVDQRLKAEEARKRESELAAERARIEAEAAERINRARELVPDFQEAIESADILVPDHLGAYMQQSEMLAELSYHFARHPEEMTRLAKLPPIKGVAELGKLETKLEKFEGKPKAIKAEGQPPPKPRAPEPITPLTEAGAATEPDLYKADYQTYRQEWAKKNNAGHLWARKRH